MVVNKNALHDIVMTYIPTKKNLNEPQAKKIVPPPIFKGPVPTLQKNSAQNSRVEPKANLEPVREVVKIIKEEGTKQTNSLISNLEENIKNSRKKKHINPIEKSVVERLIEHKTKTDFANNIISKSVSRNDSRRKTSPKSPRKTSSRKQKSYMKSSLIATQLFDMEPTVHKNPFRDIQVKLDSRENKKGGSSHKRNSKKRSLKKSKKSGINVRQTAPSYLRNDLERLLNDNDSIAFQRLF